jgi:hypothetical protein
MVCMKRGDDATLLMSTTQKERLQRESPELRWT